MADCTVTYRDPISRSALVVLIRVAEAIVESLRRGSDPMSGTGSGVSAGAELAVGSWAKSVVVATELG